MARDVASEAREAFAAGFAIAAGPLTERVHAGCEAAVSLALERPDDPHVFEVSLHLGHLEGTWAEVYRRRGELEARRIAAVTAAWRKLVRKLKPRDLIASYRHVTSHPSEAANDHPEAWKKAAARAAALSWLYAILSDPGYGELSREIADALVAAAAEGATAALAIAADQAAAVGFDWARAYDAMLAGLSALEGTSAGADAVARDIISAVAADAGRVLATADASGASDSEIAAELMDAVDGEEVAAVSVTTDFAVGKSMTQAALDLYLSEGVLVGWMDAGDGRVCVACSANADNGPYNPADFPECPGHNRCRCCPYPYQGLPLSAFAAFLVPVG